MLTSLRLKAFLAASVLLLLVSQWRSGILPAPGELDPALQHEPVQQITGDLPFSVDSGGVKYSIRPLYRYELAGLVVSAHRTDSWWDFVHREWQDRLNVVDLCVVWGDNVRRGTYADMAFSSGQFTCYYSPTTRAAPETFEVRQFSNNHLLTADPQLARLMRTVSIGDQVRFRGRLVEYSHGEEFRRGSSITRDDVGKEACETVFVDSFDLIRKHSNPWRILRWVAIIMVLGGIVAWLAQPVKYRD